MGRIISFRGQLDMDVQETIPLSTIKGLIGYKIKKFQIMSATPGVGDVEFVAQIYKTLEASNINKTPDFSNNRLLAAVYYQDDSSASHSSSTEVIFDNEKFNQDIYINITSPIAASIRCNYYMELEQMSLDLNESTMATLKDIRNIGAE